MTGTSLGAVDHWALWARGNILPPHFDELNAEKIMAAKKRIWADEAYQQFARSSC